MARRCVNGMHLPNSRYWNIEQMVDAVKPTGAITCLHISLFSDPLLGTYGDQENENWYGKLRIGFEPQAIPPGPERFIHVRLWQSNWMDLDPRIWAEHAVDLLAEWHGQGVTANLWNDPFVGISPSNEQNIEGWKVSALPASERPAAYSRIGDWNLKFWQRVDELVPERKALSVWSALAFGHDMIPGRPDSEYTNRDIRAAIDYCDVLAAHPYALMRELPESVPGGELQYWYMLRPFRPVGYDGPDDPGGILAQVPDKPMLISETGTFTHSDTSRTRQTLDAFKALYQAAVDSGRVIGITPFIWNSGPEHQDNVIWPNEELRNGLAGLPCLETDAELPVAGAPEVPTLPPSGPEPVPWPTPTPPDPGEQLTPRINEHLRVVAYPKSGEGWAAFAGRAAGHPTAPYAQRLAWAREIAAHNGLIIQQGLSTDTAYSLPWFTTCVP